jgi:tight adherence protein C
MSELVFGLGLVGIFAAVVVGMMTMQAAYAGRRRVVDLLQSQVVQVPDMRQNELSQPFFDRVVLHLLGELGQFAKRVTPIGMRQRIARQLVLAGNTGKLDADKVAATKLFGAIGGGVAGLVLSRMAGLSGVLSIAAIAFGALVLYLLPGAGLGQRAIRRQDEIRRALPDTMDLLTISVEAGLGFDAAVDHVRRNVPGPLSDEFGRFLQELQLGVGRVDAFRSLADRTNVEELKGFVLAMIQADIFGVSIGKVLRAQAKELRIRRRQRAEEQAMKMPVKLLFPLILGILPSMFVVIAGPGIIRIIDVFSGHIGTVP